MRNAHGIGTHIRDETYAAFTDVDAFVELLRDLHGFPRRVAEAVCGRLLQFRRRKRRFRFYRFVGRLYAYDRAVGIFYQVDDFIDFGFVFQFSLFTLVRNELSGKCRFAFYKIRIERPIFFGQKIFHFFFALADETKRDRLHAAGRKTVFHFAPQKRTQIVTDEAVEHAPRFLRVHFAFDDFVGMLDRFFDRDRRDFVEHDAADRSACLFFQRIIQMPCDRFSFAVVIACEQDGRRFFRILLQLF